MIPESLEGRRFTLHSQEIILNHFYQFVLCKDPATKKVNMGWTWLYRNLDKFDFIEFQLIWTWLYRNLDKFDFYIMKPMNHFIYYKVDVVLPQSR